MDLKRMTTRETLNPPAVDPAQPPMSISVSRMILERVGHPLIFIVTNPVVVMIEETWKKEARTASAKPEQREKML